jgi:hypothetical protein
MMRRYDNPGRASRARYASSRASHPHPRRLPSDGGVVAIVELLVED